MLILAILTGALSLLNLSWWLNTDIMGMVKIFSLIGQIILLIATLIAAVSYQGIRRRKLHPIAPYKTFTLPFSLILISLLGNLCVLVFISLKITGICPLI